MSNDKQSTALVTDRRKEYEALQGYLMQKQGVLGNLLAKSSGLTPERMVRMLLGSVSRTPDLLKCTPESVLSALCDAAFYSLEVNPVLGHGYILPFGGKAQFIPGYKGLILLAHRSGYILDIEATIVHERDKFEINKHRQPQFTHKPTFTDDPGPAIGVYAVAYLKNGHQKFLPLTKAEVEKYRARARGADRTDSPWKTDAEAMWKKTAIRRICGQLPLESSSHLMTAIAQESSFEREGHNYVTGDREAEGGNVSHLPAPKPRADELADRLGAKRKTEKPAVEAKADPQAQKQPAERPEASERPGPDDVHGDDGPGF